MTYANCMSCNHELEPGTRKNVPALIDCCSHCWGKIPIVDRLRLAIAVRDRSPGGVLNELTELLMRTIEAHQEAQD